MTVVDEAKKSRLERVRDARRRLPENVRLLSWVSLANDSASEMAYPIVPLFLALTLGAPAILIGLIEGIAEAMALGFKLLSGWLSDRSAQQRRRPWIMAGYGVSTFSRLAIAAAPAWGWVLGAKIVDRIGKGTRGTPRDALIRDSTPKELIGSAFGYHRSMDTVGAIVGPLIAVVALLLGASLRTVLAIAVLPGAVTLILIRLIREAPRSAAQARPVKPSLRSLPSSFWAVLQVWVIFSLGNSTDAFLLLRAHNLGLSTIGVVLAFALYNVVYAGLSWPLGALSDRIPRERVLTAGVLVFAVVYVGFAVAPGPWAVWPLLAIYGVYVAATEGVGRAWVGDHVETGAVGTAYGVFFASTAGAALVASLLGGALWSYVSPAAPFILGAATAGVAALLLLARVVRREVGPRMARMSLAGLGVAVIAAGAIFHSSLGDLFRRSGEQEVPIAVARACDPAPTTRVAAPKGYPAVPGMVFTKVEGGQQFSGFREGTLRAGHDAFHAAIAKAGYAIDFSEVDPGDAEVDFKGGDVQFLADCRGRVSFTLTLDRPVG
jgi:MFS family permease